MSAQDGGGGMSDHGGGGMSAQAEVPFDSGVARRQVIVALLKWLERDDDEAALAAINLLALSDEDIETLFRSQLGVVRVPFLGSVT